MSIKQSSGCGVCAICQPSSGLWCCEGVKIPAGKNSPKKSKNKTNQQKKTHQGLYASHLLSAAVHAISRMCTREGF